MPLEFRILGPLEVCRDAQQVRLPGSASRRVLAVLALARGAWVSADRLIDELWPGGPPRSGRKALQMHIARLRRALACTTAPQTDDVLVSGPAGYRLAVAMEQVDAARFERLVEDGRRDLAASEPERARTLLVGALSLWRGAPLAELALEGATAAELRRLEELRLAALEQRIEADLQLGRHREVIEELQLLAREHRWRERLHALLMLALYRAGRQADALQAYDQARRTLVEELGLEPGQALKALQAQILEQSPMLEAAAAGAPSTGAGPGDRPGVAPFPHPISGQALSARPRALSRAALPVAPNRTVGRERELSGICERLRSRSVRLLTLTGPGGVGKTRLALEAARAVKTDFPDGAYHVSLADVRTAEDVPAEIVAALGIVVLPGEDAPLAIGRFLAAKELLLALDNFEHVIEAASLVAGLLGSCPALTVLATSREPLSLHAEERYPVPLLAVPEPAARADPDVLAGVDAVALFVERAQARDPAFVLDSGNAEPVAAICRRVDGLPLAIELAAAACGLLTTTEIAQRLDAALGELARGPRDAPARHRTLRATIEWSHNLLDNDEKTCFARFAVFAGGATLPAAEKITGANVPTLDRLTAKSLLDARRQTQGQTRLRMLETVRAYAIERFATAADRETISKRHYRYFRSFAELHGSDRALWGPRRNAHLAQLDAEIDNLHAALDWAIRHAGAHEALSLCTALGSYWLTKARYGDAVAWTEQTLSRSGADRYPGLRIRALCIKSWGAWPLARRAEQAAAMAEAEAEARSLGDPLVLSQVLQMRAHQEALRGRRDLAEPLADEALDWAVRADDEWMIASLGYTSAVLAQGVARLRERVDRAAALLEEIGNVYQHAELLASAAYVSLRESKDRDAREYVERAMPLARELDSPFLWTMLRGNLGFAAVLTGDLDTARHEFRAQLEVCRELVLLPFAGEGLVGLAAVAAARDELQRAARLAGAAAAHRYGPLDDPLNARLHALFFQPMKTRHDQEAWGAGVADGAALSLQEAIAYALEEPGPATAVSTRGRPPASVDAG